MSRYINLPTTLDIKTRRERPATLEGVVKMSAEGQAIIPVAGDCMEAVGIEDGGYIAVDFTHYPRPPRTEEGKHVRGDPCLCYASAPGGEHPPAVMCKEYCGVWMGPMVGTRYDNWKGGDYRMDCAFPATAILGVIFAAWGRDGRLKWRHNPAGFPTEPPGAPTITGANVVVESARKVRRKEETTE